MAPDHGGKPKQNKRPHIVRSGNAGNSSKSASSPAQQPAPDPNRPPPLFPPGSKTPVQLLHERCQHNGWEKPSIEHRRCPEGFTAAVVLSKKDKKDASLKHTVRMDPRPPLNRPSVEEAKHWGATYALFRFCNNMSLHRVLPPGPKEFWAALEQEKKSAPDHRAWEFDPDPFHAALEVKKRQQVREEKIAKFENPLDDGAVHPREDRGRLPKHWSAAPEVKMDLKLRDQTEQIIRKLLTRIPMAEPATSFQDSHPTGENNASQLALSERAKLSNELIRMGFRPGHVSSALRHLSRIRDASNSASSASNSQLARTLMNSFLGSSDRDVLLQYLSVVVPEDDLPPRFRPTQKSTSFVTATSKLGGGTDGNDLQTSWLVERLNKQHGFPLAAIKSVLSSPIDGREGVALEVLVRRLAGWESDVPLAHAALVNQASNQVKEMLTCRDEKRLAEKEALEAIYGSDRYRPVSTESAADDFDILISSSESKKEDVWLRVSFHPHSLYPTPTPLLSAPSIPAFSVVSSTVPSYLRLALMKCTLEQFRNKNNGWDAMLEAGEGGVIFEMTNYLEETWLHMAQSPPDVADVMFNFVVETHPMLTQSRPDVSNQASRQQTTIAPRKRAQMQPLKQSPELDNQLLHEQSALYANRAYKSVLTGRQSLPAWSSRTEFLKALADSRIRVIVVAGETGSGKTTQLPQFVVEAEFEAGRGSLLNILCTQPRRVSAIGVATRVASERLENIDERNGIVGYSIRGENRSSRRTRLLFATSGVLLRRLATSDPDLLGFSHLFIDEVHERSLEGDLLLLELRELLNRNLKIKIILMSATANQDLFVEYFGAAKKINIPGLTHPVQDLYLEDFLSQLSYSPPFQRQGPQGPAKLSAPQKQQAEQTQRQFMAMGYSESESRLLVSASKASRYVDENLIASVVSLIIHENQTEPGCPALGVMLVFVSGVAEIRAACKAIETLSGQCVECVPLHSQLSSAEQKRVFNQPRPSKVKIVVATNIAETSITIPDVRFVIDSGREKQMTLDPEVGMSRLIEVNCSQAAAKQRRGRAGRTTAGVAYKLFTRLCESNAMPKDTKPEILRTPLEAMFLQVKAIRENEDVPIYLQKALTPPPQIAVDHAIETLEIVGAFHRGTLTALGKHLAQLPLDLRLGKLLILGSIFKVFEPTLTLAAMLSVNKPLFNSPFDKREESGVARMKFSVANSDLLTNIQAFDEFMRIKHEAGNNAARDFCQDNFLSLPTLRDIISTRSDLLGQMQERGFVSKAYRNDWSGPRNSSTGDDASHLNQNKHDMNLVKSVFAAGLSQVVRIEVPETKYDQIASGTVAKDVDSKAVKFYDQKLGRVFLHPSSVLFKSAKDLKAGFLTYFSRSATGSDSNSKVFLRDGTAVPLFGILLLFGSGSIRLHHEINGLSIRTRALEDDRETSENSIRLRAPVRIGSLCNQLRHLLDALLLMGVDEPERLREMMEHEDEKQVVECVINLIKTDGLGSVI